jgi:cysteine-rich secretory family protein
MKIAHGLNRIALFLVLGFGLLSVSAQGQSSPIPTGGPTPQAPPPAPPIETRELPNENGANHAEPKGSTLYSIGQPTDEEQFYLEYLNRMRANPTTEGQRLATTTDPNVLSAYSSFSVDLKLMQSEFSTNPPVPPVAMNAQLLAAARWHSGDMFTNVYQGHTQTNGSTVLDPGQRITANGYTWNTYGENVFAYAESVFYGHAGFAVDWGPGPGGMQTPAGHRGNMLNGGFREAGIGVVDGVNGVGGPLPVGPQLVTQDFASQSASPFITGVVYYDFNGNGFYDVGEGIGGVTVNTPGSKYYAVTADSGGYVIPVTSNGNYAVTFTATGLSTQMVATITGAKNLKIDYLPVYAPPTISGPNPAGLNQSNGYTFSVVGGATSYDWQQTALSPYTTVEGAENGLGNVTVVSSQGYSVLTNDLVASGSFAFHLAQPDAANQFLTLNPILRPSSSSMLTFSKRLGYASTTQVAKAQISTDGASTWQDLWTQAGNNGSGDGAFSTVSISLSAYAGQNIQVRFAYLFQGGSYFNQTSSGVGLYLDNIAVSNASQLLNPITSNIPTGNSFGFFPTNMGSYVLLVRARINSRILNWGPALIVTVGAALPTLQLVSSPSIAGTQVQIDFAVSNYRIGMTFQLWKAIDPSSTWTQDTSVSLQTLTANSKFRFTASSGGAAETFYRVKGSF